MIKKFPVIYVLLLLSEGVCAAVLSSFNFDTDLSATGGSLQSDTGAFSGTGTGQTAGTMQMISFDSNSSASALFTLTVANPINFSSLSFDVSQSGRNGTLEIFTSLDSFAAPVLGPEDITPGSSALSADLTGLGTVSSDISFLFSYLSKHSSQTSTGIFDNVLLEGDLTPVPLPATALLLVSGLAGLVLMRRNLCAGSEQRG